MSAEPVQQFKVPGRAQQSVRLMLAVNFQHQIAQLAQLSQTAQGAVETAQAAPAGTDFAQSNGLVVFVPPLLHQPFLGLGREHEASGHASPLLQIVASRIS